MMDEFEGILREIFQVRLPASTEFYVDDTSFKRILINKVLN